MKRSHVCPKCSHNRVFRIAPPDDPPPALGRAEAYVCERCRYTEHYTVDAIPVDERRVILLSPGNPTPTDLPFRAVGRKPSVPPPRAEPVVQVVLAEAGANPVAVTAALRHVLRVGLVEARDLVRRTPRLLARGIGEAYALRIKKALESAGATVRIEGLDGGEP